MSEAARTFKTVNGKSTGGAQDGTLTFVRPSKLAEDGVKGVVAEGIYEGTLPSKFDNKTDFKIRKENGDLIIVNGTSSLQKQMAKVATGAYVRINYKGLQKLTMGKAAGKMSHSFIVEVAD
jgi:hypothetical protein